MHTKRPLPTPNFLFAAPKRIACAAFSKESRMRFVDPTEPYRKFGSRLFRVENALETQSVRSFHQTPGEKSGQRNLGRAALQQLPYDRCGCRRQQNPITEVSRRHPAMRRPGATDKG